MLHLALRLFVKHENLRFSNFFVIRCKNAMQMNMRIESESILVSRCIGTSVDVKVTCTMQIMYGIASYCEPALILDIV